MVSSLKCAVSAAWVKLKNSIFGFGSKQVKKVVWVRESCLLRGGL